MLFAAIIALAALSLGEASALKGNDPGVEKLSEDEAVDMVVNEVLMETEAPVAPKANKKGSTAAIKIAQAAPIIARRDPTLA
jgi:hypothetical protein